jgi:hypothetical protein
MLLSPPTSPLRSPSSTLVDAAAAPGTCTACTQMCGQGGQVEVTKYCSGNDAEVWRIQPCNGEKCGYYWHTSPWSACSDACAGGDAAAATTQAGTRTRTTECRKIENETKVNSSQCTPFRKPAVESACNVNGHCDAPATYAGLGREFNGGGGGGGGGAGGSMTGLAVKVSSAIIDSI